ncbi:hypothetical protein PgNI_06564 [Pyricularia grisea]|uniref:Uncharacterized protein n=1 Tax=Pyricularia grisea TaxID=148305 RepID=A0A6P8B3T4_PYRGI|nr:hypothetical protein PgNI_06564 [Pyricularia grisea]TLD09933.1 hypothetical protein PgNI_06564 [Pyricularia grisea]
MATRATSYAGHQQPEEAESVLQVELSLGLTAAALLGLECAVDVSIVSTRTAHVVGVEGYRAHQLSTAVVAEICSIYPERNGAIVNAAVIALSRDRSLRVLGFVCVVGGPVWGVSIEKARSEFAHLI